MSEKKKEEKEWVKLGYVKDTDVGVGCRQTNGVKTLTLARKAVEIVVDESEGTFKKVPVYFNIPETSWDDLMERIQKAKDL